MAEQDQQLAAGVPRLIDQYKQRRQAWLAQADELVRLRDEVRTAAEREALEIVTAARRDVRRIVVEARRELLVLTAQLHAAIESVDQASLQAAETVSAADAGGSATDLVSGQRPLSAAEDKVLGARREVRTVLDEARAEIEALVAEANGPLREIPAALSGSSRLPDPPIPALDTILGANSLSVAGSGVGTLSIVDLEQPPVDSKNRTVGDRHDDGPDSGGGTPTETWQPSPESAAVDATSQPFGGASPTSLAELAPTSRRIDEIALVPPLVRTPVQLVAVGTIEEPAVEPLSDFGETEPLQVAHQGRTFFARGYEEGESRTRPWMWVGLFAATGILAVVSTVWWFTLRDSGTALATSVVEGSEPAAAATPVPVVDRGPAAATAESPGLGIEVRRTAWIRTIVDGKEDSRVYQAGETRQISGAKTVSIRAGDGGAVFVSVDGRPAEPLGSGGVAVTRQYSLAGDTAAPVPAVATASPVPAIEPLAATPAVSNAVPTPRPENQSLPLPGARPAEVARAAAAAAAPPSNAPATIAPATPVPGASPAPSTADTSAAPSGGGRADLIAAGQQWLDAYQRRDREGMSSSGTENMGISDERSITERFPAWQAGVRRDLDQVELELSGDTALLTARMTERSGDTSASGQQHVSRVSQIWVRRAGRWRLADVRIIGEARLNQIVR